MSSLITFTILEILAQYEKSCGSLHYLFQKLEKPNSTNTVLLHFSIDSIKEAFSVQVSSKPSPFGVHSSEVPYHDSCLGLTRPSIEKATLNQPQISYIF